MAWSLVQKQAAQSSNGTGSLPAASTAGNLLVAAVGNGSATAITPPAGWTAGPSIVNGTVSSAYLFFYFGNPGGLSSFAFTGGAGAIYVEVAEFTCPNVASLAATTDTGTGIAGAVASLTVTTGGTAQAGDLVVCSFLCHFSSNQATTWTDPTGFTNFGEGTALQTNHGYGGYQLSASTGGAQSAAASISPTSANAHAWTGVVATLSQPASGTTVNLTTPRETVAASAPAPQAQLALPAAQLAAATPPPAPQLQLGLAPAQLSAAALPPVPQIRLGLAPAQLAATAPPPAPQIRLGLPVAQLAVAAPAPALQAQLALPVAHVATAPRAPSSQLQLALAVARVTAAAQAPAVVIVRPSLPLGGGGGGTASASAPGGTASSAAPGGTAAEGLDGGSAAQPLPGGTAAGPSSGGTVT